MTLVEIVYRTRERADINGMLHAADAAAQLVPLGRELRTAVKAAGDTVDGTDEQRAALAEVVRIGSAISQTIDENWEGIRGLFGTLLQGASGEKPRRPQPPRRLGQP